MLSPRKKVVLLTILGIIGLFALTLVIGEKTGKFKIWADYLYPFLQRSTQPQVSQVSQEVFWPSTCDSVCPKINVRCLTDDELEKKCGSRDVLACVEASTCTMYLSNSMCALSGLKDGEVYDGPTFREKTQCQKEGVPESKDYVDKCCSVRHEYAHLCDPQRPLPHREELPGMRCGETFAQNVEQACRNTTIDYFCSGANPRWSDVTCRASCQDAQSRVYTKIWDACMCNRAMQLPGGGGSGVWGVEISQDQAKSVCCSCLQECQDPNRARNLAPSSCINRGFINFEIATAKYYCDSEAKAAHGCSFYFPSVQTFNPRECRADCMLGGPSSDPNMTTEKCNEALKVFCTSYCRNKYQEGLSWFKVMSCESAVYTYSGRMLRSGVFAGCCVCQ